MGETEKIVFTNGCFDVLHPGHVELLSKARALGTKLIVGLNGDESVRAIKGYPRPFLNQAARRAILLALRSVDAVLIFNENTPYNLIAQIQPDVLVKGGDWAIGQIIGAELVLKNGGEVHSIPFESDYSSSKIVEKIQHGAGGERAEITTEIPDAANEQTKIAAAIKKSLAKWSQMLANLNGAQSAILTQCANWAADAAGAPKGEIVFGGVGASAIIARDLGETFGARLNIKERRVRHTNLVDDGFQFDGGDGSLLVVIDLDGKHSDAAARAIMKARRVNWHVIAVSGIGGKKTAGLCEANISVGAGSTVQLREAARVVGLIWLDAILALADAPADY